MSPELDLILNCIEARVKDILQEQLRAGPVILGLCGAQGSGKSTLALAAAERLTRAGLQTAVLSIDDLYLQRSERERLAKTVHPLLRTRGVPGTHDAELGRALFAALDRAEPVEFPRFDKAIDDRRPPADAMPVTAQTRLVIFEGWCVGAVPETAEALIEPVNCLEREQDADGTWRRYVNDVLANAYQALFARLDLLVMLAAPDFEVVAEWRIEQERGLRSHAGHDRPGVMSDEEVRHFVAHYERLTRHMLKEMPARADVLIELERDRSIRQCRSIDRGSSHPSAH